MTTHPDVRISYNGVMVALISGHCDVALVVIFELADIV